MTLPVSENWITDFNNLRCQRDYQVDSGWLYSISNPRSYVIGRTNNGGGSWLFQYVFEGIIIADNIIIPPKIGKASYYRGGSIKSSYSDSGYFYERWEIKKIEDITEYKLFSSF